jgi:hypothetical protein
LSVLGYYPNIFLAALKKSMRNLSEYPDLRSQTKESCEKAENMACELGEDRHGKEINHGEK